jgi:predicted HTH transcriptional regulator
MDYMEETALGMDTFRDMRKDYKLPLPIIDYDGLNTIVTFLRTPEAIKKVGNKALAKLTDEELAGYEFVKLNKEVSKKDYAEHFGFNEKKAQRHLTKMKRLKLIGDNGQSIRSYNYKYVFND